MARRKRSGGWVEVGQSGRMGTSIIVSTIKIKFKKYQINNVTSKLI